MSFKGRQSAYKRMRFLPKTGEKRMAMIKELELTRDKERACIDDPILFLLTITGTWESISSLLIAVDFSLTSSLNFRNTCLSRWWSMMSGMNMYLYVTER